MRLPSARPAAGKTYTAKHEYHCVLERQIGQSKFYIIIVPFQVNGAMRRFIRAMTLTRPPDQTAHRAVYQVLAANYVAEMNSLFWDQASPELIQAYRLQGYLPPEPEEGERARTPYRHYEDVCAGDFMGNGGHVITTCSSLHKFAPVYSHLDSYGRSNVGAVILDEGETAPYMMIDPALVNNSSVSMNILNLFDVLRLSKASVPVIWIDGFATDETSGACMRAAGVQFTELACPEVNAFSDVTVTHLRCHLRNAPELHAGSLRVASLPDLVHLGHLGQRFLGQPLKFCTTLVIRFHHPRRRVRQTLSLYTTRVGRISTLQPLLVPALPPLTLTPGRTTRRTISACTIQVSKRGNSSG